MYLNAKNINSAWRRVLNTIWYSGSELRSQRGNSLEIHNLMVCVQDPSDKEVDGFLMGSKELKAYAKQLLDPKKHGFVYTYGERLRNWGSPDLLDKGVDQIQEAVKRLKKSRRTRRATAITWVPPLDTKSEEVPCLIVLDFKVRDKKLHSTAVFRSNDMFGAWPANVYGLNHVNKYVGRKIKVKPGSVTTLSVSAHIYEHDYDNVQKILGI